MKLKLLFLLTTCLMLFACAKDEPARIEPDKVELQNKPASEIVFVPGEVFPKIEREDGARNGQYADLFFKESLTTDNYLVIYQSGGAREQFAYNKELVDSVIMTRIDSLGTVYIDQIKHGFYEVKLKYGNGSQKTLPVVLSVFGANSIKYKPFGSPILSPGHKYRWVDVKIVPGSVLYGDWYYGRTKTKYKFEVWAETDSLGSDYLNGATPSGKMFRFQHK